MPGTSLIAPCQFLWADNHFVALAKPSGLLTQPNESDDENAEDLAKLWVKDDRKKDGDVFLHAVHRLDRCVEGIVLFARTSKALSRINERMRNHEIKKVYCALVKKLPDNKEYGQLNHWLRHGNHRAELVSARDHGAKKATLNYRVVGQTAKGYLVEVDLVTGRYHQIRAQLSAAGAPIIGDGLYGGTPMKATKNKSIALAHIRMSFVHPVGDPRPIEIVYKPMWNWVTSTDR